jgi:hypothetical protein
MTWYAAHLLFYVKLKGKRQTRYPLWENIVLVKAKSDDEAFARAEKRANEDACMDADDSFTWGGEPAEWVFGGIRKLTRCTDERQRPGDGTEVTYLELEAPSWQALQKLIRGEPATVKIDDGFPEEPPAKEAASSTNNRRKRVI